MNAPQKSTDLASPSFCFLADISAEVAGAGERKSSLGHADFAEVEYLIARHRVSPSVLEKIAESDVSNDRHSREELLASARRATIQAIMLATETCRLSNAFSAAGVRHLVLKGAALSQRLYGNVAARCSKDIDILVDRGMYSAAETVLVEHGYTFEKGYSTQLPLFYPKHAVPKDASFRHGSTGIEIELHHSLFPVPALLPLSFDRLWINRSSLKLGNTDLPVLAMSDEFIYLCAHGTVHQWFRLKWLQDIARFIVIAPPALFAEIADKADRLGVKQMAVGTVALADEIFRLGHIPEVLRMGTADKLARDIIRQSRFALARPEVEWRSFAEAVPATFLQFRFRPEWSYRKAVLANLMVAPVDVEMLRLPARASGIYYVARPFLWMKRKLLRLLQNQSRYLKS